MDCYSAMLRIGGPLTVEQAESIMQLVDDSSFEINVGVGELVPGALAVVFGGAFDEPGEYIELFYPEAKEGEPDIIPDLMKLGVDFDWYCESTIECDAWGSCFRSDRNKENFCYEGEILWNDYYQFVAPIGVAVQAPPTLEPVSMKGK